MSGTTTIKSYTSTKNVGYLYYTSPNVDSTYKFSISSSGTTTPGNNEPQGNGNNNGQFPGNNNGQIPGSNGAMPDFPGNNNGQMPGSNGTMPAPPEQGNNGDTDYRRSCQHQRQPCHQRPPEEG